MTSHIKEIGEAFEKLVASEFTVLKHFDKLEKLKDSNTKYFEVKEEGEYLRITFDSSKVDRVIISSTDNIIKELAEVFKSKGFEEVTISPHMTSPDKKTFARSRPTLSFKVPDTMESVEILNQICAKRVEQKPKRDSWSHGL